MTLNLIHSRLATTVILYLIVLTIWALWSVFRKEVMSPNFRGALFIAGFTILVQGFLGGLLWLQDFRPDQSSMHILYGSLGVLGIPAIYIFTQDRWKRFEMLVIGTGLLCLIALIFRSVSTG